MDGADGGKNVVVEGEAELVLQGSDELELVEGIGVEVVEGGVLGDVGSLGVECVADQGDDLLKDGSAVQVRSFR